MAQASLSFLRRFSLRAADDTVFREGLIVDALERSVSSGLRASFDHKVTLTSAQSAYSIPFGDVRAARHLLVNADQAVNLVWHSNSSVRCGLTSSVKAMSYLEGSITSLTVRNIIPSASTYVRVRGWGTSA